MTLNIKAVLKFLNHWTSGQIFKKNLVWQAKQNLKNVGLVFNIVLSIHHV